MHGRIAGIGTSADAYHITAPDPEGTGQSRAIAAALRTAGLDPSDVGHVNCHATATSVGDVAETVAVKKAIGDHPVLTAPKGSLGHLLGAAGAVEAITTILSVREGLVPPTANLEELDPDVTLDVVVRRGAQDVARRRDQRLVRLRRAQRVPGDHARLTAPGGTLTLTQGHALAGTPAAGRPQLAAGSGIDEPGLATGRSRRRPRPASTAAAPARRRARRPGPGW